MAEVFYKAVRPDGYDFYTGTVLYEVGRQLPEIPLAEGGVRECCTNTVYHASTVPAETLIGGSWPCRLFEVSGVPVAEEGHKRGFSTLKVVREIEAWRAFGPNGKAVAQLIEQAGRIPADQVLGLDAAWYAAREAAGDAAGYAAWYAAGYAAWYAAREAARRAAGEAAGYAAGAIVVRDLITEEQFNTLAGPWISVMGPIEAD